jgi:hypothetical protein
VNNEQTTAVPLTSVHTQLRAAALEMALRYTAGTDKDPMQYATSFYNFLAGETK